MSDLPYKHRVVAAPPREAVQPIDLAFDGSPDDIAIIIDGVRLAPVDQSDDSFEDLQLVFYRLCKLRDEVMARRNWEKEVMAHLSKVSWLSGRPL